MAIDRRAAIVVGHVPRKLATERQWRSGGTDVRRIFTSAYAARLRFRVAFIATVLAVMLLGVGSFAQTHCEPSTDPECEWPTYNPEMVRLRKALQPLVDDMERRVDARDAARLDVSCARQALNELRWRLHETADVAAAVAWYDRTTLFVNQENPPSAKRQQAIDGSYGICASAWFIRLSDSADWFQTAGWTGSRPDFLDRVNSPDLLQKYFESLLISDIPANHVNNRNELNNGFTTLVQLIFKPKQKPNNYAWDAHLRETVRALVMRWQDPETGFFGPWYRVNGRIIKRPGLSPTFHVVSYTRSDPSVVRYWPRLIDTLFKIKNDEYPYGWHENGKLFHHHNYDVVKILHVGLKFMRPDQVVQTGTEIKDLLSWAFKTIRDDGTLSEGTSEGGVEDYSFLTGFLKEVGYFGKGSFWWNERQSRSEFPDPQPVCERLMNRVRLYSTDASVLDTFENLGVQFRCPGN